MIKKQHISLLEKILRLGEKLEHRKWFDILEPWEFNGYDPIEIQKCAKKISQFIGLDNLTFVITFKKQQKNVAGHIELNNNSEDGVFIEIDERYKSQPAVILAILAHEICHKIIHINGLTINLLEYENEILTDVATVYCGLGKLSLNGCKVSTTTRTTDATTITTTAVGYLNRDQFSFVYNFICNMRNIPEKIRLEGLSDDALVSVSTNQYHHSDDFFSNEKSTIRLQDIMKQKNKSYYLTLSENIKLFKIFQKNLMATSLENNKIHKKIHQNMKDILFESSRKMSQENLNYVKNILLLNKVNAQNDFVTEMLSLNKINRNLKQLLIVLDGNFSLNLNDRGTLYKINCPICNHNMQLKEDKLIKINCTKCKYQFMVDNRLIKKQTSKVVVKKSLMEKFRKIFKILKE